MHNQNKILRVLQLISLLKKEPAKSIRFLSGILESTDRTVYRYLDLIKEFKKIKAKDENIKVKLVGFKKVYELENSDGFKNTVTFENQYDAMKRKILPVEINKTDIIE